MPPLGRKDATLDDDSRRTMPCARKPGCDLSSARRDDELLAQVLVTTWALATGRVLRADVPPSLLSRDELIDFWSDDRMAAAGPALSPGQTAQDILADAHRRPPAGITGPDVSSAPAAVTPLMPAAADTRSLSSRLRWLPRTAGGKPGRPDPAPAAPETSTAGPGMPAPVREGPVKGVFGVDIAGFTDPRRDERAQGYLRESMYRILERAFDGSGVPWKDCQHEDRGDGALIIAPADAVDALADPLPERLRGLVRVHNRQSSASASIQLRAAADMGRVYHDQYGYYGDAVNNLFRLLNEPELKKLLANSGKEVAFITSDHFYKIVITRHPRLVDPDAFQPIPVDLRYEACTGWVHFPGP